jgi:hypothetical protein
MFVGKYEPLERRRGMEKRSEIYIILIYMERRKKRELIN